MGFNTTFVIKNDYLNKIRKDKQFGEKIYEAACYGGNSDMLKHSNSFNNEFNIIETHHQDFNCIVAIGGGTGVVLGRTGTGTKEEILRELARGMGYDLKRIPVKK